MPFFEARTGNVIVEKTNNSKAEVFFSESDARLVRSFGGDVVFSHNHPEGTAFSPNDITNIVEYNVIETRIVSGKSSYYISDPAGEFRNKFKDKDIEDVQKFVLESRDSILNSISQSENKDLSLKVSEMNKDGKGIDYLKAWNVVYSDYWVEKFSEQNGLVYRKEVA